MGRQFCGGRAIYGNQHGTGDALAWWIEWGWNRLGRKALLGSDARVWLRAASDAAVAPAFHQTDPGRAAERIPEIAGLFAARPLERQISGCLIGDFDFSSWRYEGFQDSSSYSDYFDLFDRVRVWIAAAVQNRLQRRTAVQSPGFAGERE